MFFYDTFFFFPVDKLVRLCLNIHNIQKTLTEILPFRNTLQRAGGRCEPVQKGLAVWFPSRSCERLRQ